jgi:hypothetical protein
MPKNWDTEFEKKKIFVINSTPIFLLVGEMIMLLKVKKKE